MRIKIQAVRALSIFLRLQLAGKRRAEKLPLYLCEDEREENIFVRKGLDGLKENVHYDDRKVMLLEKQEKRGILFA